MSIVDMWAFKRVYVVLRVLIVFTSMWDICVDRRIANTGNGTYAPDIVIVCCK